VVVVFAPDSVEVASDKGLAASDSYGRNVRSWKGTGTWVPFGRQPRSGIHGRQAVASRSSHFCKIATDIQEFCLQGERIDDGTIEAAIGYRRSPKHGIPGVGSTSGCVERRQCSPYFAP